MKKSKKNILIVLSLLCAVCFSFGIGSACTTDEPTIKAKENILNYFVRDSIYVFDLFEYQAGQTYSFSFTYGDNKPVKIKGESFFTEVTGEYVVKGVARKGKKTAKESVTVKVVDEVPILVLANMEGDADLFASYLPSRLINGFATPTVLSEGVHKEYISQIAVYKDGNDEEPTIYQIEGAEASEDGFWDGRKVNLIYECKCVLTIVSETSGGTSRANFVLNVAENIDEYKDLTEDGYEITYDKKNGIISWDEIPQTEYYRVKYDGVTMEQTATSVDLNQILTGEFHYFNLLVIPVDAEGNFIGKLVSELVHLTPAGCEGVVLGNGVVSIDPQTRSVELSGQQSSSPGWKSGVRHMDNSFVAFAGDYGVNTKVEFTFKGNNLPQVCFFADNMNGNMTNGGGTGIMLMNGLYAASDDTQSTSTTKVVGEHALIYLGPNRMGDEWPTNNYISAAQLGSKALTITENTLFTQKALREDVSDRTYRYTVICTESSDGYITFLVKLADEATGEIVAGPYVKTTSIKADSVQPGNIIAWATVKGQYNNTKFSFDLPESVEENELYGTLQKTITNNSDGTTTVDMSPGFVNALGATWAATGTIRGQGYVSDLQNYTHNFVTFGEYGVGYEFVTTFTGNNMPMVMMFASDTSGSLSSGSTFGTPALNKGYVITNGIMLQMSAQTERFMYSENVLTARGPDRINYHIGYSATNTPETANGTFTSNVEGTFGAFEEGKYYKFVFGTKEVNSLVIIYAEVYDVTNTETLVFKGEMPTELTKAEIEALGKNVLLMAGVRGEGVGTKFTYYVPELKYSTNIIDESSMPVRVTDNQDGSYDVTMLAGRDDSGYMSIGGTTSSWAQSGIVNYTNNILNIGEYGVGYKIVAKFKGDNLPQLLLFADNEDGKIAQIDEQNGKGYFISNGFTTVGDNWGKSTSTFRNDWLYVYGPNRFAIGTNMKTLTTSNVTTLTGVFPTVSDLNDEITYRYEVSTKDVEGAVIIYIELYNDDTNETMYKGEYNTGKTVTQIEALGKNVIFHAGVKGPDVKTTFTYYQPEQVE